MKYRLFFSFLVAPFFAGCSVVFPFYIQNGTADSVLVEVYLQKPLDSVFRLPILQNETDVFKAAKQLSKGKTDFFSFSGKDSIWQFSIPPKSVLILDRAVNFSSHSFRSIRVGGKEILKFVAHAHNPFYNNDIPGLEWQRKGLRQEFVYQIQE